MWQGKDFMQYRDCMEGCTLNCIKCMDRMECMQARNWILLNRREGARGQGLQGGNDPLLRKFLVFLSENHVFYLIDEVLQSFSLLNFISLKCHQHSIEQ